MKKEEIIGYLKRLLGIRLTPSILTIINDSLIDGIIYKLDVNNGNMKIHTDITETKNGSYFEMSYDWDRENKNSSLVVTKKTYGPTYELRYGFREEVGLNIFTESRSYLFNQNDRLLYSSSFSDDHKYYGSDKMPLDFSKASLLEYFSDTTPKYSKGCLIDSPESAYQPFTHIWQRYKDTNVVREHGRNPMTGEYSDIKVTFDDQSHEDIKLLSESHGQFYVSGREMKMSSEDEIVETIERIYQASKTPNGFDYEGFQAAFDSAMFKSKRL